MDNVNTITATTANITILVMGVRSLSTIEKYPFYFYTHQEKTTNSTYNTYADYPYLPIISFIRSRSLSFSIGIRMKLLEGRDNGSYPFNYLEMIHAVFGKEDNTIEVCSGMIRKYRYTSCYTVDLNPETNPDLVDDAQKLSSVPNNRFNRWRGDPPYNGKTAKEMYRISLPSPIKLLQAGARVCSVGSFMFLLLGPQNYQWHPKGVRE